MNIVYDISHSDFNKIKENRIPTLIKNGLKNFPELKNWNTEYIIKKYGKTNCIYTNDARPVSSRLTATYTDFFYNLSNKNYTFTRKMYDINNTLDFIDDFTFPNPYFSKNEIEKHIFYSGPATTGALPHSHGAALNLMIYGKKKWIFFDKITHIGKKLEQYYYKNYPPKSQYNDWYNSEYDTLKKTIPIIECIQEPTDIVFVPNQYNHTVLNLETTMGIVVELF